MIKIYKKYEEIINYLIAGTATTIFSFFSYYLISRLLFNDYKLSNIVSFIFTVLFAYIINRIYVFKSQKVSRREKILELLNFYKFRLISLLIDMTCMILLIEVLNINDLVAKALIQIIILILNYIFSKVYIFKK